MNDSHGSQSAHARMGTDAHDVQLTFVLRMWSTNTAWRASLQDAHNSQRIGFASLEEMFTYLMGLAEKGGSRVDEQQTDA